MEPCDLKLPVSIFKPTAHENENTDASHITSEDEKEEIEVLDFNNASVCGGQNEFPLDCGLFQTSETKINSAPFPCDAGAAPIAGISKAAVSRKLVLC